MDFEWRKDGAAIAQQDFGRVLAGAQGGPVTVQLVNTSGNDWTATRCSIVQGDTDGGYGTANVGGVDLGETPIDAGPLAAGAARDFVLGWVTPAGVTGRVGDFASLVVDYDY